MLNEFDFNAAELEKVMAEAEKSDVVVRKKLEVTDTQLKDSLKEVWGYNSFRDGQLEAIRAVCDGMDVAVYWATGEGKSLCYQLPAIAARATRQRKTSLVISPLISLMQDQVQALKMSTGDESIACFLGSAQMDATIERRALAGDFAIVYATPEGAVSKNLPARMADHMLLLAIDEAHCVSEYGHDFRPEYRQLGKLLGARSVPMVALTATATPRIREDMETNLGFKRESLYISAKSVDRKNLRLSCATRSQNAVSKLMTELATTLCSSKKIDSQSTVIYCSTRREVDEIHALLQGQIRKLDSSKTYLAVAYHAGLSDTDRIKAHRSFLVSEAKVVVATVAFGMGIDKADIRRIIHVSPPKTFEEYTQQIGRAGRDGKSAECTLLYKAHDFDKYSSDFYTGKLSKTARAAVAMSTAHLQAYTEAGVDKCRRAMILDYFGEPVKAWRCGTCDLCVYNSQLNQENMSNASAERDFTAPARRVALAVQNALGGVPMTDLVPLAANGTVSEAKKQRYRASINKLVDVPKVTSLKPDDYSTWLIPGMVARGILLRDQRKSQYSTYVVFLPGASCDSLARGISHLFMPPPLALLEKEIAAKRLAEARLAELESTGLDLKKIPKHELEAGNGPVLDAELKWARTLERWRKSGAHEKADKYQALLEKLLVWREQQALQHSVSPVTVVPDHIIKNVAYSLPYTVDDLKAIGIRFAAGVDTLAQLVKVSITELGISTVSQAGPDSSSPTIPLPADSDYKAPQPWAFAVNKSGKKKNWEISHERFQCQAESIASIAADQISGKPIRQGTVVTHLLTALTFGLPVDVRRLHEQASSALPDPCGAPTLDQFQRLDDALAVCADEVDVVGAGTYASATLAAAYGGQVAESCSIEYHARTPDQQKLLSQWHNARSWWEALKRIDYDPDNLELSRATKKIKRSP